jgi:hypothetical protein
MSEDASIDTDDRCSAVGRRSQRSTTALARSDNYTTVVYGENAFGSVGLGKRHTDGVYRAGENKGSFEMIYHDAGSAGAGDPFNEIRTLAWKAFYAGAVLNANFSRAILTGATNLRTNPRHETEGGATARLFSCPSKDEGMYLNKIDDPRDPLQRARQSRHSRFAREREYQGNLPRHAGDAGASRSSAARDSAALRAWARGNVQFKPLGGRPVPGSDIRHGERGRRRCRSRAAVRAAAANRRSRWSA